MGKDTTYVCIKKKKLEKSRGDHPKCRCLLVPPSTACGVWQRPPGMQQGAVGCRELRAECRWQLLTRLWVLLWPQQALVSLLPCQSPAVAAARTISSTFQLALWGVGSCCGCFSLSLDGGAMQGHNQAFTCSLSGAGLVQGCASQDRHPRCSELGWDLPQELWSL